MYTIIQMYICTTEQLKYLKAINTNDIYLCVDNSPGMTVWLIIIKNKKDIKAVVYYTFSSLEYYPNMVGKKVKMTENYAQQMCVNLPSNHGATCNIIDIDSTQLSTLLLLGVA